MFCARIMKFESENDSNLDTNSQKSFKFIPFFVCEVIILGYVRSRSIVNFINFVNFVINVKMQNISLINRYAGHCKLLMKLNEAALM